MEWNNWLGLSASLLAGRTANWPLVWANQVRAGITKIIYAVKSTCVDAVRVQTVQCTTVQCLQYSSVYSIVNSTFAIPYKD